MTNQLAVGGVENEAAVEQKVLFPLLTLPAYLALPPDAVKPKAYLAPTPLDKEAGRTTGYFPDYSVWIHGYPILIVEAKDPSVAAEKGFREASIYARHLNARYPTGMNPCHYVMASNGIELLAGFWDQERPSLKVRVRDLGLGTDAHEQLLRLCHYSVLEKRAGQAAAALRITRGLRPYQHAGGQALINAKRPLNTFAADLSPVLRRYFSSTDESNSKEIAERAYVSSAETTEYESSHRPRASDTLNPMGHQHSSLCRVAMTFKVRARWSLAARFRRP